MIRALPTSRIFPIVPELSRRLETLCEESIATIPETIRALSILPELSRSRKPPYKESNATIPEMIRALPTSRIFPIVPELSRRLETLCLESFHLFFGARNRLRLFPKLSEQSRLLPNFPEYVRTLPKAGNTVRGIDCDYSRNDPSLPDLARTLPKPKTTVRGIDCDYSQNDPSLPDLARTLPKPKTTVFGVFTYISRYKESNATIPEMIRALPTFPEFSRLCPNSPEGLKHRVRGIDCDYSQNDPSPPDLSRTLPKSKTAAFGVFSHIFKTKESITTTPEIIRARADISRIFPILPELSRRLETPSKESIATIPKVIRALPTFPELSRFGLNCSEG
ncbi:hypothetical protein NQ317_016184 [Molorchus minor]|uniref:Uncharacterized protein n=1 Tax=Molorchus minor TaxID=1323400 RepID=A0ABQ9JAD3_9CUCU|nr:hypothetical protein NQ317_016184 [Molorchus minor]